MSWWKIYIQSKGERCKSWRLRLEEGRFKSTLTATRLYLCPQGMQFKKQLICNNYMLWNVRRYFRNCIDSNSSKVKIVEDILAQKHASFNKINIRYQAKSTHARCFLSPFKSNFQYHLLNVIKTFLRHTKLPLSKHEIYYPRATTLRLYHSNNIQLHITGTAVKVYHFTLS